MPSGLYHTVRTETQTRDKRWWAGNSLFSKKLHFLTYIALEEEWNQTKILPQHALILIGGPPRHLITPKLFLSHSLLLFIQSFKMNQELCWFLPREKESASGNYQHHIVYQNIKFGRNPTVTSSPSTCWWSWRCFQDIFNWIGHSFAGNGQPALTSKAFPLLGCV